MNNKQIKIIDLLKEADKKKYVCCKVKSMIHELNDEIDESEKSTVAFLDLTDAEAVKVYERSLRFVLSKVLYDLFPNLNVKYSYSVSRSIYCQLYTKSGEAFNVTTKILGHIKDDLDDIIKQDLPICRNLKDREEILKIYENLGIDDKVEIIKRQQYKRLFIYNLGDYYNYMYGPMCISTGYLASYAIRIFGNGFVIQYPRAEEKGKIPKFEESPTYGKTLGENALWGKQVGVDTLPKINKYISEHGSLDYIGMCESHHNNMLAELGTKIANKIYNNSEDKLRLICIAGPSSSGKTTFANRLRLELMSKGINPVRISIDDYYLPREQCPLDEDGKVDLETIKALNTEQFNEDILNLIEGEEVCLPIFDFKNKKHLKGEPIKLEPNQPIIIEGIHALNDLLTPSISRHQKFKIYIAPQAQINIDNQNPLSLTDLRLLRRIVRDYRTRGASPHDTINMWPSVRKGEFKWIYDTQEGADFVFNSLLPYELNVMKTHAIKILQQVSKDDECYSVAKRLIDSLFYLDEIDDNMIPNNSLMREFIGGSCFYDA